MSCAAGCASLDSPSREGCRSTSLQHTVALRASLRTGIKSIKSLFPRRIRPDKWSTSIPLPAAAGDEGREARFNDVMNSQWKVAAASSLLWIEHWFLFHLGAKVKSDVTCWFSKNVGLFFPWNDNNLTYKHYMKGKSCNFSFCLFKIGVTGIPFKLSMRCTSPAATSARTQYCLTVHID